MHRALIVLTATAAGTAAVLAFHPQPKATGPVAETALPHVAQPRDTTSAKANTIVLGPAVRNQYGTVQVQVAMSGGKIAEVRAVRLPDGDGTSQEINRSAGPQLKQQALQAQSAKVDGVSGATYTSDGYRQSLQAALDRAAAPAAQAHS